MKKDDDGKKNDGLLNAVLQIGTTLFGKPDPAKAAKRKRQLQMLVNLEYPGGKRVY